MPTPQDLSILGV